MTQAWDPTHTFADVTLSGSNLIATKAANSGTDSQTYGAQSVAAGRYYWEITSVGSISAGGGIGNISSGVGSYLGGLASNVGWFGNGQVLSNNGLVATWVTFASGNTLGFAMDLVSNKLWGRVGAAGNWNNAAIGSQNPSIFGPQVGGLAIPAGVLAAAVVPGANLLTTSSDVITGKFAPASWAGTPPVGFGPFDAMIVPAVIHPQKIQIWG